MTGHGPLEMRTFGSRPLEAESRSFDAALFVLR